MKPAVKIVNNKKWTTQQKMRRIILRAGIQAACTELRMGKFSSFLKTFIEAVDLADKVPAELPSKINRELGRAIDEESVSGSLNGVAL